MTDLIDRLLAIRRRPTPPEEALRLLDESLSYWTPPRKKEGPP